MNRSDEAKEILMVWRFDISAAQTIQLQELGVNVIRELPNNAAIVTSIIPHNVRLKKFWIPASDEDSYDEGSAYKAVREGQELIFVDHCLFDKYSEMNRVELVKLVIEEVERGFCDSVYHN